MLAVQPGQHSPTTITSGGTSLRTKCVASNCKQGVASDTDGWTSPAAQLLCGTHLPPEHRGELKLWSLVCWHVDCDRTWTIAKPTGHYCDQHGGPKYTPRTLQPPKRLPAHLKKGSRPKTINDLAPEDR